MPEVERETACDKNMSCFYRHQHSDPSQDLDKIELKHFTGTWPHSTVDLLRGGFQQEPGGEGCSPCLPVCNSFPHIPFSWARLCYINTTHKPASEIKLPDSGAFFIPNPFRKKHEGFILPINLDYSLLLSVSFSLTILAIRFAGLLRYWACLTENFKTLLRGRKNHQLCVLDYCKGVINYAGFGMCYATHGCLIAGDMIYGNSQDSITDFP